MSNTVEKIIDQEVKFLKKDSYHVAIIVLLVINLIVNGLMYLTPGVWDIEAMKVGGKENFKLVKQIYTSSSFQAQQKQSIEGALGQMNNATPPTANTNPTAPSKSSFPSGTLTKEQLASINRDNVEGEKNTKLTLIEYSDLECPFCKRHHDAGTVKNLVEKYKKDINHVFKNFPLSFHPYAQKAAEGSLCVAQQEGVKSYYEYINNVFAAGTPTQDVVKKAASDAGMGASSIEECLKSDKTADAVKAEMNEGQSLFQVSGTPGNVILNNESGEWVLIAGAYPLDAFEAEVKRML